MTANEWRLHSIHCFDASGSYEQPASNALYRATFYQRHAVAVSFDQGVDRNID